MFYYKLLLLNTVTKICQKTIKVFCLQQKLVNSIDIADCFYYYSKREEEH